MQDEDDIGLRCSFQSISSGAACLFRWVLMTVSMKIPPQIQHPFRLTEPGFFSNADLIRLYLPVLMQQVLSWLLGFVDTLIVSQLSDTATAGISHIATINSMANCFFAGLTTGGSVLTSQYIGSRDRPMASSAARMSLLLSLALSFLSCCLLMAGRVGVLHVMLGELDAETHNYALFFFTYSIPTYFLNAIFYAAAATFRAQGSTAEPMLCAIGQLVIALALKAFFFYALDLGVFGLCLSNLISIAVTDAAILILLERPKMAVSFRRMGKPFLQPKLMLSSFGVSIPVAIESALFQLGLVIVQRLVASYGTMESAANGIAKQLQPISYLIPYCWGTVALVVIGRCVGAKNAGQAKLYARHIMKIAISLQLVVNLLCILLSGSLVRLFGGTEEALVLAKQLFLIYCLFAMPFYSHSFTLPQVMQGAGDTKAITLISLCSMFLVRIGVAWLLGTPLGLRTIGVWIAMGIDWIVRAILFTIRSRRGCWLQHRVI